MSRKSLVAILAEDQRQQRFAYQYLKRLGYVHHEIFLEDLPKKGSGEQWVRLRYSDNVKAYRTQSDSPRTGLVVLIDADNEEVARRSQQLNAALREAGADARNADERISHLVPRRNIETWILCLNDIQPDGRRVNEDEDYKRHAAARRIDESIQPAAEIFHRWSRRNALPPQYCLPSIFAAIPEIKKLEQDE